MADVTPEEGAKAVKRIVRKAIEAETPERVDELFDTLSAQLSAKAFKVVVDAIEAEACAPFMTAVADGATHFKTYMEFVKGLMQEPDVKGLTAAHISAECPSALEELQAQAEVFFHLSKIKGANAHPVVKAYTEELAKLSGDGYNSVIEHINLMSRVQDVVDSATNPPPSSPPKRKNPFQKPSL